ncbi:YbjQ family protein [Thermodesulfobacteriota bacterium]
MEQGTKKTSARPIMTTSAVPPAEEHEIIAVISGASVFSRHLISDLGASIKNTVGGELKTYSSLLDKAFSQAMERLVEKAASLGADGVFGIQLACPQISPGAAEVLVAGTAYRILEQRAHDRPNDVTGG